MKATGKFDIGKALRDAKAGVIRGEELYGAIRRAETMGLNAIAKELKTYIVHVGAFAGDPAPPDIKQRFAEGTSALKGMGFHPTRTFQMLERRLKENAEVGNTKSAVIGVIDSIGKENAASENFWRLVAAGRTELTAEAVIVEFPQYFSSKSQAVATKRLALIGTGEGEKMIEKAKQEIAARKKA